MSQLLNNVNVNNDFEQHEGSLSRGSESCTYYPTLKSWFWSYLSQHTECFCLIY